jgi:hypothetical protein
MTKNTLTQDALHQFTGTEHWYRRPLARAVTYTDGAKYVAEQGGAYWLLDIISIAQRHEKAVSAVSGLETRRTGQSERHGALAFSSRFLAWAIAASISCSISGSLCSPS